MKSFSGIVVFGLIAVLAFQLDRQGVLGHLQSKRLHDDLFSDYNRLIRPARNFSEKLIVNIGLKLTQIVEINLKAQVMTTSLWLEQSWHDYKLEWNPADYGGVDMIHVPAENIWLPDIVLFNNADGNYEVTLMTKATVYSTGMIVWNPPALYKSACRQDIEYFPFDVQTCLMKFASWTYDGYEVDLRHKKQNGTSSKVVSMGIELSDYIKSVEWDLLLVPAKYNEEYYECCKEPYPDLTFNVTMRRKTLFYTVNLIIPCVGVALLTVVVFYLPSDSGEKISLSISILVAWTIFFLLLAEICPPTSLAIPLLGKYLLFTIVLIMLSICCTVLVLNIHFRSPSTHIMNPWIKKIFIEMLPSLLLMERPTSSDWHEQLEEIGKRNRSKNRKSNSLHTGNNGTNGNGTGYGAGNNSHMYESQSFDSIDANNFEDFASISMEYSRACRGDSGICTAEQLAEINEQYEANCMNLRDIFRAPEMQKAISGIVHLANHLRKDDEDNNVMEDWKFVAMVLDRFFLWVFTITGLCGTCAILLKAPSLYDTRASLDNVSV